MKAEDYLKYCGVGSASQIQPMQLDIYNSLKRLEELEAKPAPKYRLTRDIESIGAKKGDTIELRKDYYGEYYSFFAKEHKFYMSIGLVSTVDPSLIEEVRPKEVWIEEQYWDSSAFVATVHYSRPKPSLSGCTKISHFIEVEE